VLPPARQSEYTPQPHIRADPCCVTLTIYPLSASTIPIRKHDVIYKNRKYATYHNAVRGRPSHGHKKFGKIGQTDRQTHRHSHHNTLTASRTLRFRYTYSKWNLQLDARQSLTVAQPNIPLPSTYPTLCYKKIRTRPNSFHRLWSSVYIRVTRQWKARPVYVTEPMVAIASPFCGYNLA